MRQKTGADCKQWKNTEEKAQGVARRPGEFPPFCTSDHIKCTCPVRTTFLHANRTDRSAISQLSRPSSKVYCDTLTVPHVVEYTIGTSYNPKVHYRIHNSRPLFYPEPAESSPSFPPYFFTSHFNIILPSTPKSSKRSRSFRFPQNYNLKYLHSNYTNIR